MSPSGHGGSAVRRPVVALREVGQTGGARRLAALSRDERGLSGVLTQAAGERPLCRLRTTDDLANDSTREGAGIGTRRCLRDDAAQDCCRI